MKRILTAAAVAAVAALAAAAPASADPPRYNSESRGYVQDHRGESPAAYRGDARRADQRFSRDDLARLQARIDWGVRSGGLNRYEARRLSFQLDDLRQRARYYWRTDGLSWRERQDLEARYDRLNFEVRRQIRDDDYGRGGYRR